MIALPFPANILAGRRCLDGCPRLYCSLTQTILTSGFLFALLCYSVLETRPFLFKENVQSASSALKRLRSGVLRRLPPAQFGVQVAKFEKLSSKMFKNHNKKLWNKTGMDIGSLKLDFDPTNATTVTNKLRDRITRRKLLACLDLNPYLGMRVNSNGSLDDDQAVSVTVSGVFHPSHSHFIAVYAAGADTGNCASTVLHTLMTGDLSAQVGTCSTPIKFKYLSEDPGYLSHQNKRCHGYPHQQRWHRAFPLGSSRTTKRRSSCAFHTHSASLSFRLLNIRTPVFFVLFAGLLRAPCIWKTSQLLHFRNPDSPLYGHLALTDSSGTEMRLTWVSGSPSPQQVCYYHSDDASSTAHARVTADGHPDGSAAPPYASNDTTAAANIAHCVATATTSSNSAAAEVSSWTAGSHNMATSGSTVTTFTKAQMCGSPAIDEGFHDPGYIHSAVLSGLRPNTVFNYKYGSPSVGFSQYFTAKSVPAGGQSSQAGTRLLVYGDMGVQDRDGSGQHYGTPGSLRTLDAIVKNEITEDGHGSGLGADAVFHVGDISYATGYLATWDEFLSHISPVAHSLPYMTAEGNHERDWPNSGSFYSKTDSGGECGIPFHSYFPMPTPCSSQTPTTPTNHNSPWYSVDIGLVHMTVMSTERDWSIGSQQWHWLNKDLNSASLNRDKVPWIVFAGHRTPYSSVSSSTLVSTITGGSFDPRFAPALEALNSWAQVDLAIWGHVHDYERTCQILNNRCVNKPITVNNTAMYMNNGKHHGPVHTVNGMAGFSLDEINTDPCPWSLAQESAFGYSKITALSSHLDFRFIHYENPNSGDHFQIYK